MKNRPNISICIKESCFCSRKNIEQHIFYLRFILEYFQPNRKESLASYYFCNQLFTILFIFRFL